MLHLKRFALSFVAAGAVAVTLPCYPQVSITSRFTLSA